MQSIMDIETCITEYGLSEIQKGTLAGQNASTTYTIIHGHCLQLALITDVDWMVFLTSLFNKVPVLQKTEAEKKEILDSIVMQDIHWSWFRKSAKFDTPEYEWFYITADKGVQGVCLIYHPKPSVLENGDIFYVEFVSVAPWNRTTKINDRQYEKIGTTLLKAASQFAVNQLNLKPGFSLHSLPQSETYYAHQGMTEIPGHEKENLKFFEMTKSTNDLWRV